MIKSVPYTAALIVELQRTLSPPRLSTYLAASGGDVQVALWLYSWNADVSGALYMPLQGLEIALRNALHDVLSAAYSPTWYATGGAPLAGHALDDVTKAEKTLFRRNCPAQPPHMVAELSFGFWVSLLDGLYHNTLWTPILHKAFPHAQGTKRKVIYNDLNHLRKLRNRIAHHEPIFKRHLAADYESIIKAIDWISPETAAWVDGQSRVHEVLQSR